MRSLLCLPFCLALSLLCFIAETSQYPSDCCLKTSNTRIPEKRVVGYKIQTAGVCPIDAVILFTLKGKTMCCTPNTEYIQRVMKMVDQKKSSKQNSDPKALPSQKRKQKNGKRRRQKKQ